MYPHRKLNQQCFKCILIRLQVLMDIMHIFFLKNWDHFGGDMCKVVQSFFSSGRLLTKVNHMFVTLVPKTTNYSHLNDFRPMSCCNTVYKLISKVISQIECFFERQTHVMLLFMLMSLLDISAIQWVLGFVSR